MSGWREIARVVARARGGLALIVLSTVLSCGREAAPEFGAPGISEVAVVASYYGAEISFRVDGNGVTCCGVTLLSEDRQRFEAVLGENGRATVTLDNLSLNTQYRFAPFAGNEAMEVFGEECLFSTLPMPEVRLWDCNCYDVQPQSARVSFRFSNPQWVTEAGCYYYAEGEDNPDTMKVSKAVVGGDNPALSATLQISGLEMAKGYFAVPYVQTAIGEIRAEPMHFATYSSALRYWGETVSYGYTPHIFTFSLYVHNYASEPASVLLWISSDKVNQHPYPEYQVPYVASSWHTVPPGADKQLSITYSFAISDTDYKIGADSGYGSLPTSLSFHTPAHTMGHYGCFGRERNDKYVEWTLENDVPDTTFRRCLLENYDLDNDGDISCDEANAITYIDCHNLGIRSLKGIYRFGNLFTLECSYNPISVIHLRDDDELLTCCQNQREPNDHVCYPIDYPIPLKNIVAEYMYDMTGGIPPIFNPGFEPSMNYLEEVRTAGVPSDFQLIVSADCPLNENYDPNPYGF